MISCHYVYKKKYRASNIWTCLWCQQRLATDLAYENRLVTGSISHLLLMQTLLFWSKFIDRFCEKSQWYNMLLTGPDPYLLFKYQLVTKWSRILLGAKQLRNYILHLNRRCTWVLVNFRFMKIQNISSVQLNILINIYNRFSMDLKLP